jgi:hypothetical protein
MIAEIGIPKKFLERSRKRREFSKQNTGIDPATGYLGTNVRNKKWGVLEWGRTS